MESAQLVLTYLFDVVFYGFSTLFIFDFLWGLSSLINEIETLPPVQPTLVEKEKKTVKPGERLSFEDVCIEFAKKGLALERHRSGHYCYRVVFGCDSPPRFKRLQDALNWLTASTANKSQPEKTLLLVE
jgi:hypothetical protein